MFFMWYKLNSQDFIVILKVLSLRNRDVCKYSSFEVIQYAMTYLRAVHSKADKEPS